MRRLGTFVVAVPLLMVWTAATAEAQVCLGAPSLQERHVRVGGGIWGTSDQFGYEAFVTAGRDFFGTFSVGQSEYDPWDGTTIDIGLAAGYDFPAAAGRVSICPRASVGWELGPDNILDTGTYFDASSTSAGVSAGVLATRPGTRIGVIPYVSLGVAHRRTELSGFFEQEQSDTYGRIGIGVGLQNGRALIRPWLSVPFSTDFSGPASFGVSASFQF